MIGSAAEPTDLRVRRQVVSFVRRSNRMRPNQRRAWEVHRERYLLDVPRHEASTSIHPDAAVDLDDQLCSTSEGLDEIHGSVRVD